MGIGSTIECLAISRCGAVHSMKWPLRQRDHRLSVCGSVRSCSSVDLPKVHSAAVFTLHENSPTAISVYCTFTPRICTCAVRRLWPHFSRAQSLALCTTHIGGARNKWSSHSKCSKAYPSVVPRFSPFRWPSASSNGEREISWANFLSKQLCNNACGS